MTEVHPEKHKAGLGESLSGRRHGGRTDPRGALLSLFPPALVANSLEVESASDLFSTIRKKVGSEGDTGTAGTGHPQGDAGFKVAQQENGNMLSQTTEN